MTVFFSHFCFAVSTSTNYTVDEDLFSSGGDYSKSASYSMQDYGNEIVIIEYNPEIERPAAGGGVAAAPAPAPAPVPPPADVIPPIISTIVVSNITENSAQITWATDENSSTELNLGLTIAYDLGLRTGLNGILNHEIVLLGLSPSTLYHFYVRSSDAAGNTNSSVDKTFTTLPDRTAPIISEITVTEIAGISAKINWTTNESANSRVDYGTTLEYESGTASSESSKTNHGITISGLTPATLYHFRVRSTDAARNEVISLDQTFTTIDTISPIISDIRIENVTSNSATIEWRTNEISTGLVGYGRTVAYEEGSGVSAMFALRHEITLRDLIGNTTYHYHITSEDILRNESSSADLIFTTSRDSVPPANVSNFRAEPSETSIKLTWNNPPDADFNGVHIVRDDTTFPTAPVEGVVVLHGLANSITDRGLSAEKKYFYTAFSYDTSENFSTGAIISVTTESLVEVGAAPAVEPGGEEEIEIEEIIPGVGAGEEAKPSLIPLKLNDILFLASEETITLPVVDNKIKTIVKTPLQIVIPAEKLSKTPKSIILKVGGSNYLLSYSEEKKRHETKITTPESFGNYLSTIIVVYNETESDFINFTLFVDKPGLIFESVKGEQKPVEKIKITLYRQSETKEWQIWNAEPYSQINPKIISETGNYYFFAPDGLYYLTAEKEDYRAAKSAPIDLRDGVINKKIELLKPPTKLSEVIVPDAPLIENIQAVTKNISEKIVYNTKIAEEEIVKVIDDPRVEKTNTTVAVPTIATVAIANAGSAFSFLNLLNYAQYLFTQPLLLLSRKKRKGWGSVYHTFTKLPIDLAIVRLKNAKTNQIIQTRVTDTQGRFAFIVPKGKYLIEAKKQNFIFPTKILKKIKQDAGMQEIYHGETIDVDKDGATIMVNIPLDPVEKKETAVPKKIIFKKFLKSLNHILAFAGILLSLVSFIISPSFILAGFFIIQILLYLLFRRLSMTKKPKAWGLVYDRKTRRPLSYVIARLFETQFNKLLETQITDSRGRYTFLVGKNIYYTTFEKKGYEQRKTDYIDLRSASKENVVALDIGLNKKT